jgi:hypothetical protein
VPEIPDQQFPSSRTYLCQDLQVTLDGGNLIRFIKQRRIKSFYVTSENAVKTQIWVAISVYVLVAIVRKRSRCKPLLQNPTDFESYSL